ncbi:MAG: WD40 repeat domain-containing protein [Planctomycetes bacterium]|nr:WD40 repeat domain-containing protein [Planctomycetota bacterium]
MRIHLLLAVFVAVMTISVGPLRAQQLVAVVKESLLIDTKNHVYSISLSHDEKKIALALRDRIQIRSLFDGSVISELTGRAGGKHTRMQFVNNDTELKAPLQFLKDSKKQGRVRKWNVATGKPTETIDLPGETQFYTGFSQDARVLLVSPEIPASKSMRVWDLTTGEQIILKADGFFWRSAYICPKKKTLVTLHPHELWIWDYPSGKIRHKVALKKRPSTIGFEVSFSADGKLFLYTYPMGYVTIWDAFTGKQSVAGRFSFGGAHRHLLFPDGTHILVNSSGKGVGEESDLYVYDTRKRVAVMRLQGTPRRMEQADLVISRDGTLVAQSTATGTISIWKLPRLQP